MDNLPVGVTAEDFEPNEPPAKFLDLFTAEFDSKPYELWDEYCDSDTELSPESWVEVNYPETLK